MPVIVFVDGVDHGKHSFVSTGAFKNFLTLFLILTARPKPISTGSGDYPFKRLFPCPHAGDHGVTLIIIIVFVVLIAQVAAWRTTVTGVANQPFKPSAVCRSLYLLSKEFYTEAASENRLLSGHLFSWREHLVSLFLGCGTAEYFSCWFIVISQHV